MAANTNDVANFSKLVGLAYDCVGDVGSWEVFLRRTCEHFDVVGAQILRSNMRKQELLFSVLHGVEASLMGEYAKYAFGDPLIAHVAKNPGKPWSDVRAVDAAVRATTPLYLEFFQKIGIAERAGFSIERDDDELISFAMFIGLDRDPFSDEEFAFLTALQPHLVRALTLHDEFVKERFQKNALLAALEPMPLGIVVVDRLCRIYFSNAYARETMADERFATARNAVLSFKQPELDRQLHAAIEHAVSGAPGGDWPSVFRLEHPDSPEPVFAFVRRASASAESMGLDSVAGDLAIVYISNDSVRSETSESLLSRMFGLTRAEARTARGVVEGRPLAEIATEHTVSVETVRSHLKKVFEKTGCSRQHDLVRLVLSTPAWLRHAAAKEIGSL